jgi:membrane-bound inhibitor of C-type lysozyme
VRFLLPLAACAFAATAAAQAPATARGEAPFVVVYECSGGAHLAVGYPAYRDARRAPVRIGWQGRTIELAPARAASGARYVNAIADLEWWSKGSGGTLSRLRDNRPLLAGCTES